MNENRTAPPPIAPEIEDERRWTLEQLEDWLEIPMIVLSVIFLVVFVVDLVYGSNPLLDWISTAIWIIFGLEFGLRFMLAPRKLEFLKSRWLTVISLLLPALRVFRVVRAVRVARALRATRVVRGLRLVRVIGSLNRAMNTLRAALGRRGFGYVLALTVVVTLVGAAGILTFESDQPNGLHDYGSALWWTSMLMTTLGSEYWPQSLEGRLLCFALSLYAFTVFGYVTATLATYFLDRDAAGDEAQIAGADSIAALREEIVALRREVQVLARGEET